MTSSSETIAVTQGGIIVPSPFPIRWPCCIVLLLLLIAVVPSHGQNGRRCADGKKLTMDSVEGYIHRKQDEKAVAAIESCHVGFSLEAVSLQRLVHAGMQEAVFAALNRDTVAQMTAEQAHTEVNGLQANPGDAQVEKVFEARIAYLRNAEYAVAGPFAYKDYEQNTQVMTASIGDSNYLFRPVASGAAQKFSTNPKGIRIVRHFEEDKLRQRVVRLPAEQIEITGNSQQAMVHGAATFQLGEMNDALIKGSNSFDRGDYDQAAVSYAAASQAADGAEVLNKGNTDQVDKQELDRQIHEGNKRALDRITEINRDLQLAKQCKANGTWCVNPADPNALVWELKDNGQDIDAHDAANYCTSRRTGNYSDWRLASVLELSGLFDPGVTRNTPPTTKVIVLMHNGAVEKLPKGTVWQYHIKGGIELTGTQVWSSTPDEDGTTNRQALGDFEDGNGYRRKTNSKERLRALCVRGTPVVVSARSQPGSSGDLISVPGQKNSVGGEHPVPVRMDATATTPADQLERQAETLYIDRRYDKAFPMAKQSCDEGSQDGCALLATMCGRGFGVQQDVNRGIVLANQSCDAGRARGCEVLGVAYYIGLGVPKDQFHAAELVTGSCKAGFMIACFDSGMQHLDGNGVAKDVPLGVQLLHESCSGGFQIACKELLALRNRGIK